MAFFSQVKTQSEFFDKADSFFQNNVTNGGVHYSDLVENSPILNELVGFAAAYDYSSQPENEKAYLINVYNLLVIKKVVENWPCSSPQNVAGFFEGKNNSVGSRKISLNEIENELLRAKYNDARLHFVLVCAGKGCPPIIAEAYRPEQLEIQLERQTNIALNNENFIYQDKATETIYLSEIFNWYGSDFGKNTKETITYINEKREEDFDDSYKVKYSEYDWSLNSAKKQHELIERIEISDDRSETRVGGQTFNPGSLLRKGQYDITNFNTLYTQTKSNWMGVDYSGFRENFVTNLLQVTYGVSENNRFNIGFDVNLKSSGRSVDSTLGGLPVGFTYSNSDSTRGGVTSLGPRIKFQPFKNLNDLSVQSTFLVPTISNPEGGVPGEGYWADWDRYTWWNQIFYTKSFGNFQLFTEVDLLFRFRRRTSQIGMLDVPLSAFLSYFPNPKLTLYIMSQHVPRFTNGNAVTNDWVIPMNYSASGLGMKYQLTSRFNIELLYTNFWRGKNTGFGSTFNLGLKFLSF
ncbi:MAG: hypothetical protein ACI9N1_001499 [Flavobacteriales bacterium]|jgi:hypothetical protein